jgi:hypothetical protein
MATERGMFGFFKSIVDAILHVAHHFGSGLSAAVAFGFVAYLLDIGGFRTSALMHGTLDSHALFGLSGVFAAFVGFNVLMKRFMGKHGLF